MSPSEVCDVAIVGGGVAGMITAVRAAQADKRVLVLERQAEDRYLCNSRLTGGVFHCALRDIRTPPEELSAAILETTGGAADPALARLVGGNAKRAVDWLQSLGVRFVRGSADPWHSFVLAPPGIAQLGRKWEGRAGDVLLRTLEAELNRLGGRVLRGREAFRLVMDGPRCRGIEFRSLEGAGSVEASAVVLADGGFQASQEMLAEHVTPRPNKVVQRNAGNGLGAGMRMARDVGAALTDLNCFYGHVLSRDALENDQLWPYPWLDEVIKRYIVIGRDGRRFADEGRGGVYVANAIARLPEPDSAFVVCDEDGWNGAATERFLPANPNLEKAGATVLRAQSLAELAGLAGVDRQGLEDEIARYNDAVDARLSERLTPSRSAGKFPPLPIRRAPFYLLPAAAGITYTMGGVKIDDKCRVQSTQGGPIEGLYAVGSTTGGVEGGPDVGYVGGLVKAATTALACAEHLSEVRQ